MRNVLELPTISDDSGAVWPAVSDPAGLLAAVACWLQGYGNHSTRRTYVEGLGLPGTRRQLVDWLNASDAAPQWAHAVARYAAALGITADAPESPRNAPPPAAPGRLRDLHWFRWCARHAIDPTCVTTAHVTLWLDALGEAGAAQATRDRMLATLKALYAYLAEEGIVPGNPAAINRRRLGLRSAGQASGTVTLTPEQVRRLFEVAGSRRRGVRPISPARGQAIVALLTLGLRVGELCALDRDDLHVTRGRRALRVSGKGGKTRIVYLSQLADEALAAYLRSRDAQAGAGTGTAVTTSRRAAPGESTPLIATVTGGRTTRQSIWQLLRTLARAAGGSLEQVADRLHPHALRHFYVTTAVEAGAQLVHVQADVGHSSVDTTEGVYNAAARDPRRSAVDLVADAVSGGGR